MLTEQQGNHFDTFGFLLFPRHSRRRNWNKSSEKERRYGRRRPALRRIPLRASTVHPSWKGAPSLVLLAEDDRLYGPVEQLVGPGFTWGGSEGAWCKSGVEQVHRWHSVVYAHL